MIPNTFCSIQFTEDFRAPKPPENNSGEVTFKLFKQGETATAYKFNQASTPLNYVAAYKTLDGYTVPMSKAYNLGEVERPQPQQQPADQPKESIEEAVIVEDVDMIEPKTIKRLKTASSGAAKAITKKNKSAVNGALIGAGAGVLLAMLTKKNKYMFASLGAVAGFVVGNMINTNKDDIKSSI